MDKILIKNEITNKKLRSWFKKLPKTEKFCVLVGLSFDTSDDKVLYNIRSYEDFGNIDDVSDEYLTEWLNETSGYKLYTNYIIFNNLPLLNEDGRIKRNAFEKISCKDVYEIYEIMDKKEKTILLNVNNGYNWSGGELFSKFNTYNDTEKIELYNRYFNS